MVDLGGSENRNQIRFTACRQYSGESVISFADPTPETTASAEPRATKELELPGGLDFTLSLAEALELKNSAVGDPVAARLQNDVKHKGHVLIPKGAVVSGRVTTLQKTTEVTSLGLTFSEITAEGLHASVKLSLDNVIGVGRVSLRGAHFRPVAASPGEGIVLVPSTQPRIMRGTLMYWRN